MIPHALRVAVLGAGAIGRLQAAAIAYAMPAPSVALLRRPGTPATSLCIQVMDATAAATTTTTAATTTSLPSRPADAAMGDGAPHIVVVTTKAFDVTRAVHDLLVSRTAGQASTSPATAAQRAPTAVVLLCNGALTARDRLLAAPWWPRAHAHVLLGLTTHGARLPSSADSTACLPVMHTGVGETLVGMPPATHPCYPAMACWRDRMLATTTPVRGVWRFVAAAAATQACYRKLALNAVINPLAAALQVPNGALATAAPASAVATLVSETAHAVWTAMEASLDAATTASGEMMAAVRPFASPADLAEAARALCALTAANWNSMAVDVQRGGPTELDALYGGLLDPPRSIEAGQGTAAVDPVDLVAARAHLRSLSGLVTAACELRRTA
ncbi:hypothetical protein CXG81DRAFT_25397 [Caulochytrium protostelioides]|uniref:2-dehydropantoate 2-reductase n=1 Tax=Caulochytrium protostelioides TaxID=1555241 RepID=A0A4P9X9D3_9FUNG|nr:hypothetical protein CXG81DRAFT_25397 [Caulochytrium protostelioides]|eukprot:RKP01905.1 hypothetical protein CXG81DRAFT_25397 [Caulochytrium protostelioides]